MAFSFSSITDAVSNITGALGNKDSASVFGIDIGSSSIKVVQLKHAKGVAVLETYGEIALGPYATAEVGQSVSPTVERIAEALREVIKVANVTAQTGGLSIPLSSSLISVITLPTKNHDDLKTMVPIEARKYIPVPVSEVELDWFEIPDEERNFMSGASTKPVSASTDVLMVAIHRSTLSKFNDISKSAGIAPSFYEIEPFSFARASYEHGTQPILMIDFGAASTRVYIIEFGVIHVSHTINRGGQDITLALSRSKGLTFGEAEMLKRNVGVEGEEAGRTAIDYIFSESRRIVLTYQRKAGKAISKVVMVGGGTALKGLDALGSTYFDAPIQHGAAFERVAAPAFISNVLSSTGPMFASAVGLALRALEQ